ncbi:MAG TPA: diaminopimelate epimerase [Solirubrobacteraceae bacterium]|jgi:diaminopimelate epimerase|nr:diaminopimelate epimerase [Solirubrobacteraceae bacterium]
MRFEKWQALGNDYLIVERDELAFELTPARIRLLCEGHFGVYADGVLLLSPPVDPANVADLRIFNPDGSEAELSGNGAREAILYLRTRGWTELDEFSIDTAAGTISPQITGASTCRVDMGQASLSSKDFPSGPPDGAAELRIEAGAPDGAAPRSGAWSFQHVSIGNPQCAIAVSVEQLEALDLPLIGPPVEAHAEFPNRTNVSWYAELEPGPPARIRARIFERGVGETLSSGTGATGAAVAYLVAGSAERAPGPPSEPARVIVVLDGGELEVEVDPDLRVHLSGWALPVFAGTLSEPFLEQLRKTN